MEPQLVHSQRLGKQVSRELRGWNRSLRPHCPTPTLREKGASGLWDRGLAWQGWEAWVWRAGCLSPRDLTTYPPTHCHSHP